MSKKEKKNEISRIRLLRKKRKLTQSQLADYVGVSQQTMSRFERNVGGASGADLAAMADLFDCTVDYLLERDENKNIPETLEALSALFVEHPSFFRKLIKLNAFQIEKMEAILDLIEAAKQEPEPEIQEE